MRAVHRGRGVALVLGVAVALAGCSSSRDRSGDTSGGESFVKPGAVTSARATLEAILEAYRIWDLEAVLSHVDADFYPQFTLFRQSLYEDREKVDQVQLDVIVNQEIASGESIVLSTRWNRVHTPNSTAAPVRTTGMAQWHFDRATGKLLDIRGTRPIGFN